MELHVYVTSEIKFRSKFFNLGWLSISFVL